jgi:RimJ/RimL family protein N-acetyltransferase
LHVIDPKVRRKGYGQQWFALSLKKYFQRHGLEKIICQPAASNPGPNQLLKALGMKPMRIYTTTPSPICFEHEVARYEIYGYGVPVETIESLK